MNGIDRLKRKLESSYREFGAYMIVGAKFLTMFLLLLRINMAIGSKSIFSNIFVELIAALVCSILPANAMLAVLAAAVLVQLAALSLSALAVGGSMLLIVLLLYFSFSPRQTWAFLLTLLGLFFHIPCIAAIGFGLMGSVLAAAAILEAAVLYYSIFAVTNASASALEFAMTQQSGSDKLIAELQSMIHAVLTEQEMILMILTLLAVFAVVFFVRKMAMKYAWKIAIAVGGLIYLVLMMAGWMMLQLQTGLLWILLGTVLSVLIAWILEELFFSLDYRRTESLQFEDSNYYYYVKAFPKKQSEPEESKRINRKGREQNDEYETIRS